MDESVGGDWSGFDDAALSALDTDFAEIGLDSTDTALPDPIDGADAPDMSLDATTIPGDAAVESVAEDGPIIASDGTGYENYSDFITGDS